MERLLGSRSRAGSVQGIFRSGSQASNLGQTPRSSRTSGTCGPDSAARSSAESEQQTGRVSLVSFRERTSEVSAASAHPQDSRYVALHAVEVDPSREDTETPRPDLRKSGSQTSIRSQTSIGSQRKRAGVIRPYTLWSASEGSKEGDSATEAHHHLSTVDSSAWLVADGANRVKHSSSKDWAVNWCLRSLAPIDPRNSSWLHKWDIIHAVQLAAISFVWPYETAFLEPQLDLLFVFNRICDISLLVDMVMQFLIAYPDPLRPERVIRSHKSILLNYLRGWFIFDLLSVLPVDIIYVMAKAKAETADGGLFGGTMIHELPKVRALRYVRVVRLVRLVRFVQLFERWQTSFGISYAKSTLLKLMATLVLCCHWLACLWGHLAFNKALHETNWLQALRTAKGGPDFPEDDHVSTYSLALYWAIITITSIGYGDITPQTMLEYHVSTVCSTVMASIWAYVIGAICGIVSTLDQHEASWKRTMDDLNWFMEDKDMPPSMRTRLRRYFHEAKEMKKQNVEKEVITQMSPLLQGEVSMFMHQRWISKVWYLRDMNREIIVWAARNLTLAVFAPGEEVLDERTLFIVQRGVCSFKGRILVSGDIWGEDMLLSNPFLREQSKARAMSHLAVLTLTIVDLLDVVICFAEARARLRWAQIQIATMRGIQRIAKKLKALQETEGFNTWELTDDQRAALYRDILQGAIGDQSDEQVVSLQTDFFSLQQTVTRRNTVLSSLDGHERLEMVSASPESRGSTMESRASAHEIREMKASMMEIQHSLEELRKSIQHSSLKSPTSQSFGASVLGNRELTRSKVFTDIDIGPLESKDVGQFFKRHSRRA